MWNRGSILHFLIQPALPVPKKKKNSQIKIQPKCRGFMQNVTVVYCIHQSSVQSLIHPKCRSPPAPLRSQNSTQMGAIHCSCIASWSAPAASVPGTRPPPPLSMEEAAEDRRLQVREEGGDQEPLLLLPQVKMLYFLCFFPLRISCLSRLVRHAWFASLW